jgi:hypothetical protein
MVNIEVGEHLLDVQAHLWSLSPASKDHEPEIARYKDTSQTSFPSRLGGARLRHNNLGIMDFFGLVLERRHSRYKLVITERTGSTCGGRLVSYHVAEAGISIYVDRCFASRSAIAVPLRCFPSLRSPPASGRRKCSFRSVADDGEAEVSYPNMILSVNEDIRLKRRQSQ